MLLYIVVKENETAGMIMKRLLHVFRYIIMENFSKKFQSPTQKNANAAKEGKEEDGDKRKKKKKANENILAQTKTDNYADDESLYEPRYTKKQRLVSIRRML